jgi:hypothetical protein
MRSLIGKRARPACPGEGCRYVSGLPSLASLILPMAIAMCHPAMADERVGVNSAVNPAGTGTPPSGSPRQLMIGQDVIFKERVNTEAAGQTQILFLDQSSMSVGPNSDLTIDEFVYDPHADTASSR